MRVYKRDEIEFLRGEDEHFIGIDLASKEKGNVSIDQFCIAVEVTKRALFYA